MLKHVLPNVNSGPSSNIATNIRFQSEHICSYDLFYAADSDLYFNKVIEFLIRAFQMSCC